MLESLPSRPLTTAEGFALHQSDAFRMVTPASVSTRAESDDELVSALVAVRDGVVFGVYYDVEADGWDVVYRETYEEPSESNALVDEAGRAAQDEVGLDEADWEAVDDAEVVRRERGESEYARRLFDAYDRGTE
ncbi:hypothetical protein [Halocalculus aciditolerans]|nr:hypothetical protein [Halocalculus aciditolerans]